VAATGRLSVTNSAVEPFDPISLYAAGVEAGLECALWLRPSEDFALVGIGRAWAVEPAGPERFGEAAAAFRGLVSVAGAANVAGVAAAAGVAGATGSGAGDARRHGALRGIGPVLMGGLGFSGRVPAADGEWSPFRAASLILPSLTALRSGDGSWLTTATVSAAAPDASGAMGRSGGADGSVAWPRLAARASELAASASDLATSAAESGADVPLAIDAQTPDREHWRHAVGLIAGAVGRGRLDKVVLARRLGLTATAPLDVPSALRRLAVTSAESSVFAFHRGATTFMGATPERLARTDGRAYRTVAIAGSTRRGATPAEDDALAAELMTSDKEREEHAVVVRTIRRQLEPISERLEVAARPSVLRLRHVQHLVTEFTGSVRGDDGLLGLAGLLHPTPAVGGEPRDLALAMVDEHEDFERGWYAGPIGWLSPNGDGELMVALRCGLVRGSGAALFAGCGIVADSDPDREWDESTIKLRTLAAALGQLEGER
jgi:isochorismate synthase